MDKAYVPQTQRGLFGNIAIWVVALTLLIGGIIVGGWRLKWWMAGNAVNYQAHIFRSSYAYQQTLRDQITSNIGTVFSITSQMTFASKSEAQSLQAQRLAVLGIVCQDASEVVGDPLPTDQATFIASNCTAGVVNPNSTYEVSP